MIHSLVNNEGCSTSQVDIVKVIDCNSYSDLTRLLRVTKYVVKFICNLRNNKSSVNHLKGDVLHKAFSATDLDLAEAEWLKTVQAVTLANEIQYMSGN